MLYTIGSEPAIDEMDCGLLCSVVSDGSMVSLMDGQSRCGGQVYGAKHLVSTAF